MAERYRDAADRLRYCQVVGYRENTCLKRLTRRAATVRRGDYRYSETGPAEFLKFRLRLRQASRCGDSQHNDNDRR